VVVLDKGKVRYCMQAEGRHIDKSLSMLEIRFGGVEVLAGREGGRGRHIGCGERD
jgi:hypothetical protein